MKRISVSACSERDSEADPSSDLSPLPLRSPKHAKIITDSILVPVPVDQEMVDYNPPRSLTAGDAHTPQGRPHCKQENSPHGGNQYSGNGVFSASPSVVPTESKSNVVKRKKKLKKTEEPLDWRNFNGKPKKSSNFVTTTTLPENNDKNVNATGYSDHDAKLGKGDSTSYVSPNNVAASSDKINSSAGSASDHERSMVDIDCQSEGAASKTTEGISEYGRPPQIMRQLEESESSEEIVNFGTKNNPVQGELNLRNYGLPHQFGPVRAKPSRAKSSSSERGALGRRSEIVPMEVPRPVYQLNWRLQKNEETVQKMNSEEEEGCCEAELTPRESKSDKRKADKEIPAHTEKYIDSHCHLDFIYEKNKFSTMDSLRSDFKKAFPSTFSGCIANFIKPENWYYDQWIKDVVKDKQVLGSSWGVHPHHSGTMTEESLNGLKEYIVTNKDMLKIVAIGECGVDLSGRNDVSRERQLEVFKFQVEMAYELDLPIIIHCREGKGPELDPEDDILEVLKERPNHPIHRHCFTRDIAVARKWMTTLHNCSFGFTPMVRYSEWFDRLIKLIPLDRVHLETDAPYFQPSEYVSFSQMNCSLPGAAITVAVRISEILGLSLDEVLRTTRMCTNRIYRLPRY